MGECSHLVSKPLNIPDARGRWDVHHELNLIWVALNATLCDHETKELAGYYTK